MDAVTVVGAGGIGCAIGWALASQGVPVTFVEADPAKVEFGQSYGVAVDRRRPVVAPFVHFDDWRPTPHDVVWLCTKCYDNAAVLARLPAGATVIPVQNGFDPQLDELDHCVEGIASFVSECQPGQTRTRITRPGDLHLGPRRATSEAGLNRWITVLAAAKLFRVVPVCNIQPFKNTKLMYNAAISPLAAAAGLDNGQLLTLGLARRLFFRLLLENHAILTGANRPLGKVGPLRPSTVAAILRHPALANALAWAFIPGLRGTYCSMAGDIAKGRTEIANYTGHLLRLAGDRPCPLNRKVYDLVTRLEGRREVPGVAALQELEG